MAFVHSEMPGMEKEDILISSLYPYSPVAGIGRLAPRNISDGIAREQKRQPNRPLVDVLAEVYDDENDDQPCFFCHH